MRNPLILKLQHGADLTEEDRVKLRSVTVKARQVNGRRDLTKEGEEPDGVRLVMSGFACRYKVLADGNVQILSYLAPGDICDLHVAVLRRMDHSIATLSPCEVIDIPQSTVDDLTTNHPRISRALRWATLVDQSIAREWLVSLGQRSAEQRLAHLICEMHVRLGTVGLVDDDGFEFPLTQADLGRTLGLSTVHVNRCLQNLRAQELITLRRGRLSLLDVAQLQAMCEFDAMYLHRSEGENRSGAIAEGAASYTM